MNSDMDILQFVVEKTFAHPLDPRHISISSRRKLIAIVTGGQQVECFRFNGSRAFWHKRSGTVKIAALSWVQHSALARTDSSPSLIRLTESQKTISKLSGTTENSSSSTPPQARPLEQSNFAQKTRPRISSHSPDSHQLFMSRRRS